MYSETKYRKTALIIMDGWGKEIDTPRSAISAARTPFVEGLYENYPNSLLTTFGEEVGLPKGQMGNSEVGHMNLGAGRIVFQELQRINQAIESGDLRKNTNLLKLFVYCKKNYRPLHLIGLVSDGGVHSHINHLIALCKYAEEFGLKNVFLHCFTDGRDCPPDSSIHFIERLENELKNSSIRIASVIGRYYAMDRDKRWERIAKAYNMLVNGVGKKVYSAKEAIEKSYQTNITDEFIEPHIITDTKNQVLARIQENDAVLCFNFRTDRCREITEALSQSDHPSFGMQKLNLHYTTMTNYDDCFENVSVLFEKDNLNNTLGEVLANNGRTQLRIAETEKYPHVSFFFSGGREDPFKGEHRIMVPSPKVPTYDLQPEMSALELTKKATSFVQSNQPDFLCLNFANTDMVGHTGVFDAAVIAAETVDSCLSKLIPILLDLDYHILLTADHGNADIMLNEDGSPHTAHTTNLVPLFYINTAKSGSIKDGKLGDLAPTLLHLMGIQIPKEMTGNVLL